MGEEEALGNIIIAFDGDGSFFGFYEDDAFLEGIAESEAGDFEPIDWVLKCFRCEVKNLDFDFRLDFSFSAVLSRSRSRDGVWRVIGVLNFSFGLRIL